MEREAKLVIGFPESESQRIEKHLSKLFLHLTPEGFVIVGGLAIRYHLHKAGIAYPQRPFNDIDIVAEDLEVVHPDIVNDFLVYHFHRNKNSFYLALVDEETKTKVDIFDNEIFPEGIVQVNFKEQPVKVASIEDQLVKTVYDLQRISVEQKVDPKQFFDARLLISIADIDRANVLWRKIRKRNFPESLTEALNRAESIGHDYPDWIKEHPFLKAEPYRCPDCVIDDKFPLAPMEKIYKILGFVE